MAHFSLPAPPRNTTPGAGMRWLAVGHAVSRAFERLLDAIYRSRQWRANRDIARYCAERNLRISDAQERALSDRLLSGGNWKARR